MPYQEFAGWWRYYLLEPWGWHDSEYRTAALLSTLVNLNVKKQNRVKVSDFVRDMEKSVISSFEESERRESIEEVYKNASQEEKKNLIKQFFGV